MSDATQRGGGPAPSPLGESGPVRVVRKSDSVFYVYSSPQPIHEALVSRSRAGWVVVVVTARVKVRHFDTVDAALWHAGSHVAALARVDLRQKFTGYQRFLMGRNQCPALIPCRDEGCSIRAAGGAAHPHFCKAAPAGGGTIWCEEHAFSSAALMRPGDAFRSLDESPGGGGSP